MATLCLRDELLRHLAGPPYWLSANQIRSLQVADVADGTRVRPAMRVVAMRTGAVTEAAVGPRLRRLLTAYLTNTEGAPFQNYRPGIGRHLFPSPMHSDGLSRTTVLRILARTAAPAAAAPGSVARSGSDGTAADD